MRAVVLAYHDIGVTGLRALLRHGFEVAAVFTHTDNPHENIWFKSVAEFAANNHLPVHAPSDINHPLWVDRIRSLAPDVLFSFYYRDMLRKEILEVPKIGAFNLHGSLLPKYRGRAPINWVLVHGEKETGVTLHHMTVKPDAGDIVGQRAFPIADEDTAQTLMHKADRAAGELLDELLPQIAKGTPPRAAQDLKRGSYFGGRRPDDGRIDWTQSAAEVRNLVRAVTRPYPGAFTHSGRRKVFVWRASVAPGPGATRTPSAAHRGTGEGAEHSADAPGTVVSVDPLVIACGAGALQVDFGEAEGGVYTTGTQLAQDLNLVPGTTLGEPLTRRFRRRKKSVLILGVNGFIGRALSERLLESGRHEVHGMDLRGDNIADLRGLPDFHFHEGDIAIHREWIEYHVRKCDVVLPLVAIATPIEYMRNAVRVFELDFEENLRVIRYCVTYGKRVVFPSTSEVYGMCTDEVFDEDHSNLVLGPVNRQRWIYACAKQLLDRVIWAYGQEKGLSFTLFRPFNWIGPRLDSLDAARIGSSRAITQLILNLVEGTPIQLIDGGAQKRCFTDLRDGIECLYGIIENEGGRCDGRIFNIGNPANDLSIRGLAELLVQLFERHPLRGRFPPFAGFQEVAAREYYGSGYQDVQFRRPSIANAQKFLGWEPKTDARDAVGRTLDYFLRDYVMRETNEPGAPARIRKSKRPTRTDTSSDGG